jgi:uncharacterized protein YegP (UPF0339 family)
VVCGSSSSEDSKTRRERRPTIAIVKVEVYRRADGLFGWRLKADNHEIVATDGSQGYSERNDAREGFLRVHEFLRSDEALELVDVA